MLVHLNLKQTKPIEFNKPFEAYILQQYGETQLYEQVKDILVKVTKLRNTMDFDKLNISIANDAKTSEDLEQNLVKYMCFLNILNKRFRFEHQDPKSVNILFFWSCSYNQTLALQSSSMKYEMASIYYNLAIAEYYLGQAKLLKETDQDRKQAIPRLRNGIWAIEQCKQIAPLLPKEIQDQNFDFSLANLDMLHQILRGLAFKALYENIVGQEKQIGLNNVASTLNEAANEFKMAQANYQTFVTQFGKKAKEQTLGQISTALNFNYIWCLTLTCIKMAQFHYSKVQDDPRGQNMSKSLGFIAKADSVISPVITDKKADKIFAAQQLDALRALGQQLATLKAEYTQKNQIIYKEQTCQEALLPFPPVPDTLKIKPQVVRILYKNIYDQPPLINEPAEGEQCFEGFVSEEAMQLTREIKSFVDQRRYDLEQALKVLNDEKNKAYAENYVNYFIDMMHSQAGQQSQQLPQSLKIKIDTIRQRGGMTGAQRLMDQQKQMQGQCGQQLGQIRDKIANEKREDDGYRQQFGQKWTRQVSDNLNKDFSEQVKDYGMKMSQAQQIDFELQGLFQSCQQYFVLTEKPDQDIAQQLPQSNENNEEFLKKAVTQVEELVALDQNICNTQDQMKQSIFKFCEIINQTNFTQAALQGIKQGTQKEQIFQQIMLPSAQVIEQFNQQMSQVSALISQICGLATSLSSTKRSVSQIKQSGNNFTTGFGQVSEFFDNVDYGLAFYTQLCGHLVEIDRKVSDYIVARNIERDELIQTIQKSQQSPQQPGNQPTGQQQPQQPYKPVPQQNQYPQQYPQQYPGTQQQYPQQQQQQYPGTQQQYPSQQYPGTQQQYPPQQYQQPPQYYPQQQGQQYPQQYPAQQQYPQQQQYGQPQQGQQQYPQQYPQQQGYPQQWGQQGQQPPNQGKK